MSSYLWDTTLADQAGSMKQIKVQRAISDAIAGLCVNPAAFDWTANTSIRFVGFERVFLTGIQQALLNAVQAVVGYERDQCPDKIVNIVVSESDRTIRIRNRINGNAYFIQKIDAINRRTDIFRDYLKSAKPAGDPLKNPVKVISSKEGHIPAGIIQIMMACALNNCLVHWNVLLPSSESDSRRCEVIIKVPDDVQTP